MNEIYKENKLFLRWSEITDIFVIHEYQESFLHLMEDMKYD